MNDYLHDEEAIFNLARKLPPEDRTAYLKQVCGEDRTLQVRVESLLKAHDDEGFLEVPSVEAAPTIATPVTEGPGTTIGRFKLLQKIGEGGFGVVFMAEQKSPVVRKVALKVIKPGMDSRAVVARFEAERQALALMDHPNIAHILDGGVTDSGRPYFVMELVKGIPITEYCDKNDLSTEDRLGLFIDVCKAVQHAHQRGIIHRDLKPSNVMVTLHDGKPVPRVIDFGVSKALHQRLTEKTLFTAFGQMIGTAQYMSPEQAEMSGLDVDTRSDVYSLGVLLYELLTGTTPLEAGSLREAGYAEIQRIIKETEPPRPSIRLSTEGEKLTAIAKHRSIEPKDLQRLVRGDLDWIVMKALDKERTRRYENTSDLADDVGRFLSGKAVEAHPPSPVYRFQKCIRRNKIVTAALAITLAAMLVIVVGISAALVRERSFVARLERLASQEQRARMRAEEAENNAVKSAGQAQSAQEVAESAREAAEEARISALQEAQNRRRQQYVSDMSAAMSYWERNRISRVVEILQRHIPTYGQEDLRGFEWYYLFRQCEKTLSAPGVQLEDPIGIVRFSPDGKTLAVGFAGGSVTLLDVETRTKSQHWSVNRPEWVPFVAFSPNGEVLAHPDSRPSVVNIREIESGKVQSYQKHKGPVRAVAFSPNGQVIASSGVDKDVCLWNWKTGETIQLLSGHSDDVYSLAFSPKGSELAVGGDGGDITIWDIDSGSIKNRMLPVELQTSRDAYLPGRRIWSLTYSPNGKLLAAANIDHNVKVWDLENEREYTLRGHMDQVRSLSFLPDSRVLVSGARDNSMKLWDVERFVEVATVKGHSASTYVDCSCDGLLASGSADRMIRFWGSDTLDSKDVVRCEDAVRQLAISHSGEYFAAVVGRGVNAAENSVDYSDGGEVDAFEGRGRGQRVVIGQVAKAQCVSTIDLEEPVLCFAASHQDILAVGGQRGAIELWEFSTGKRLRTLQFHEVESFTAAVFSPDGQRLFAGSDDGTIVVWGVARGDVLEAALCSGESVDEMAVSGAGDLLATATNDGELRLIDAEHLTTKWTAAPYRGMTGGKGAVTSIALSNDGRYLASLGFADRVLLWDFSEPAPEPITLAHRGHWCANFLPDGRTLACGGSDGRVTCWDLNTRQERFTLSGHASAVHSIAASRDQRLIASGGREGTIRLWRAATEAQVRAASWDAK